MLDEYTAGIIMIILVLSHFTATQAAAEAWKAGVSNRMTRIQQRYAEYGGVIVMVVGLIVVVLMLTN